ncbi:SDR family NAD(P)-dependent oxidoreductase [Pseudonocardia sp. MH-G8]|uniref:SDR family NAD(P)-dependent oxidoreductase n=1 Tax=Pseudonocardia sp. MH-G8 TaxID=1854588 RepID=UPI000BA16B50|nr:SDR family NAD(P)-dependent oxidoreductase [Pseudonocardia sp. MH-G8]OZM78911.1 dehydrogenase [Pseudonocardia sp. MH-G8]
MRLEGKVAVITGAGQGIGRAYASAFAAEGARVVAADLNGDSAESTAQAVRSDGGRAIAIPTDVSDERSVELMVSTTVQEFGTVDILVNNAAIFSTLKMKPFTEISADEWNKVLAVNATGTFLACKAVAPIMRANSYGRIINISSSVVVTGRANYSHYVASKGAVWALTHALATELGDANITVNAVSPHGIVTEIPRETISEEQWAEMLRDQALKRRGEVSDVVGAVLFLASDESKYMTGQTLSLDAGLRFT